MSETEMLSDHEKAEVALGAAVGGGCRTCAEHLLPRLQALGASAHRLEDRVADGLAVRQHAAEFVRETLARQLGRSPVRPVESPLAPGERVEELSRAAAAAAANCAPATLLHLERARCAGATASQIEMALAIARTVRSRAQSFSDEEVARAVPSPAPDRSGEASSCGAPERAAGGSDRTQPCCG